MAGAPAPPGPLSRHLVQLLAGAVQALALLGFWLWISPSLSVWSLSFSRAF